MKLKKDNLGLEKDYGLLAKAKKTPNIPLYIEGIIVVGVNKLFAMIGTSITERRFEEP